MVEILEPGPQASGRVTFYHWHVDSDKGDESYRILYLPINTDVYIYKYNNMWVTLHWNITKNLYIYYFLLKK
jgi:hypothetical protein